MERSQGAEHSRSEDGFSMMLDEFWGAKTQAQIYLFDLSKRPFHDPTTMRGITVGVWTCLDVFGTFGESL